MLCDCLQVGGRFDAYLYAAGFDAYYEKITSDDRVVKVWRPHYQESTEVINMEKNTINHSAHSIWKCQYHIVFCAEIPQESNLWTAESRYWVHSAGTV